MQEWFKIKNIDQIDSPALVVYPERIKANIELAKKMTGDVNRLCPHAKTGKIKEIYQLMMQAGISKFKCATIAEAEMLALIGAPVILLAYQPVGPKINRLIRLIKTYHESRFSCLIDHPEIASEINKCCHKEQLVLDVFIDLNTGMNRTGIPPSQAPDLVKVIRTLKNLRFSGLHGYDGHIHEPDIDQRRKEANSSYAVMENAYNKIQSLFQYPLRMIVGGTPTFPIHAERGDCECSPGTFVLWDYGHMQNYTDMQFEYAALVICRVISIIDNRHLCLDLGHKSIAAEKPQPRVYFLNAPEAVPVSQSEEHLVVEVPDSSKYKIGQVFYGAPQHICPTVALYEKTFVIENGSMNHCWNVVARNRFINC